MGNRKVSRDVSDNIIAGAVMASSVLMSGAARIIEAHASDTKKVTVNKGSYEIPVEIGAFWFLVDTATHVDSATDIDTGVVAASTAYYLYAVTDESAISFKTSLSGTSPTGYDTVHSKLLGGFTTDGSKDITAASIWDVKMIGIGAKDTTFVAATGSGAPVRQTSPDLVTPALGTPASGDLKNCSVATEANKGVTVYSGTTKALAATDTASAMTPADVAAANAVLAREPDQGVAMTYAASGSTGIQVADNDNIDFGTGNFTLVWRGSLPDWTPSADVYLMRKDDGANGWAFIQRTTVPSVYIRGIGYVDATVAPSISDSTVHEFSVIVTRETASVAGSVVFYVDGCILGASVAIAAGAPTTVTNADPLFVVGDNAQRTASTCSFAATYNRALTAAEVLDLYRNGVSYADKWGSQTSLVTGDNSTFASDTGWWSKFGTPTIGSGTAEISNGNFIYRALFADKAEKKVRVIATFTGSVYIADGSTYQYDIASGVPYDYTIPVGGTGSLILNTATSASIDTVLVYEIGATLCLLDENIQPSPGQWLDASTNLLHAMQPATGSSLTRPKKDFEYRWTNTWTASSAAQYVGGLNQNVLSADHFITDIITQATVTTDVENLELGDGSAVAKFVAAFTPSATRTKQTIAAQNDGTNLKLVYTPAAEATMTVETIIRGFIWEP